MGEKFVTSKQLYSSCPGLGRLARFKVSTGVVAVSVTPCQWVSGSRRFEGMPYKSREPLTALYSVTSLNAWILISAPS